MSSYELPFVFVDNLDNLATANDFLLNLPKGIQSKEDLFSHYEKRGNFPGYFGNNWDALLDCLRDFSWITQRRIIIIHNDLPLSKNEGELRVYLEILATAVEDWKEVKEGPFAEVSKEMPYEEHELLVVFPSSVDPRGIVTGGVSPTTIRGSKRKRGRCLLSCHRPRLPVAMALFLSVPRPA